MLLQTDAMYLREMLPKGLDIQNIVSIDKGMSYSMEREKLKVMEKNVVFSDPENETVK